MYGDYIDEPIAMIRKWGTFSDTLWYHQGNNYNVEAITDRTGTIVERYEYSPYGNATVYTGSGTDGQWFTADDVVGNSSVIGNNKTFQGRELDAENGMYYFRNRYYLATMGRFVSRDPVRLRGGDANIYRFTSNSPFDHTDPIGLKKKEKLDGELSDPSVYNTCADKSNATGRGCLGGISVDGFSVKCDGNGYLVVDIDVDLTIYLLPADDPLWDDPVMDSQYGLINPSREQRRDATRRHEQEHRQIMLNAYNYLKMLASGIDGTPCGCADKESLNRKWSQIWRRALSQSDALDAGGSHHD